MIKFKSCIWPALLALTACSTTVPPLDAEFPTPLIENLPISIGLIYDEDLREFTYNETVSDGTNWTIELGTSNIRLFDRLFTAMFQQVRKLDSFDDPASDTVDAIVRPVLEEFAFLTPNELGSRFYAVSIRYRIFLYDKKGEEIAAWPINAYGQSRASAINAGRMKIGPLQNATNLAMRDAAASVIITLRQQTEIIALIDSELQSDALPLEN